MQCRQRISEILRQRRVEGQAFGGSWMDERQAPGMQHLAGSRIRRQGRQALILPVAVGRIAHERETKVLEVHPNLVRSAGV